MMNGFNINVNVGNQYPQAGAMGCGFPSMGGVPNQGMFGGNPMMQMMQMLLQMMMTIMGSQMGQMGMGQGFPMPFGNPGFGNGAGMPMMPGGFNPMGNFLGGSPGGFPGNFGFPGGGFSGGGAPGIGGPAFNGYVPPSSQGGQRAVDVARQFLGQRSRDIKGSMPHFQAAGGLTNNCADFVSSALRSGGMLGGHEVNVKRLEQRLLREGWRRIPAEQAGPGDVAMNPSRGHVVLCQGNGMMIGSNNVRQGLQYITEKRLPQNWIIYRKG